jgi:glycosyltransferase involved in cell wall biosynthesis
VISTIYKPFPVAFVVHVMQVAGAEVLVRETIRRLGSLIDPTIFCLDSIGMIGEQLQEEGVPVVCLDRKPGRDFGVSRRMADHIRSRSIRILHAHQYTPFFYASLAKPLAGNRPKLILTEHGRHYPDLVSPIRRAANRLIFNRFADEINACIGFSAKALSRVDGFSGHRIRVIENGIDLHKYDSNENKEAIRSKLGLHPTRQLIAMIARFHPVKDHAMAIRAFAQVTKKNEQADLLLVGDGPLRQDLELLVRELGITRRVHFLGVRSDVPQILQAVDIFTLTSVSEAASLTLLEAMACRLPVVVTAVGGNPEIVRDGIDGLLVPRGDDEAEARAILQLLNDPLKASAMGRAGRLRVEERYRLEQTVEQYYHLYCRLAGRSPLSLSQQGDGNCNN